MDFKSIALTTRPRLPLEKTIVRESSAKLECLAAAIPPNGSEERQLHGCLTSAQVILLINQPRTGQETTQQETRLKEKPSNLYKERVHAASSSWNKRRSHPLRFNSFPAGQCFLVRWYLSFSMSFLLSRLFCLLNDTYWTQFSSKKRVHQNSTAANVWQSVKLLDNSYHLK